MNTFLGASSHFGPEDIDVNLISSSRVTYLEGFLYDSQKTKDAFAKAGEVAHSAGHRVSLTLSDPFCVDRHRESFRHLIRTQVDILFANEDELLSLYEVDDFNTAIDILRTETALAAVTRGEKGSVIIGGGDPLPVPAEPVSKLVDTTGAGDQYAAGFLLGIARDLPRATCARLGHLAAAEVISHYGPRPEVSLKALAETAGITL